MLIWDPVRVWRFFFLRHLLSSFLPCKDLQSVMDNCQSIQPSCHQSEKAIHSNFNLSPRVNDGALWSSPYFRVCGSNPMVWPFKWNLFSSTFTWCYIYLVCSSNFWVCGWNPMVLPFQWNLFSSIFTWSYLFSIYCDTVLLTF